MQLLICDHCERFGGHKGHQVDLCKNVAAQERAKADALAQRVKVVTATLQQSVSDISKALLQAEEERKQSHQNNVSTADKLRACTAQQCDILAASMTPVLEVC